MTLDELHRQSKVTAADLLETAKADIDEIFNERGYAKQHPDLVAAYMRVAAYDLRTMLEHQDRLHSTPASVEVAR